MIRVGVVGAAGRMGSAVRDAVTSADDLELTAAVDTAGPAALTQVATTVVVGTGLEVLEKITVDVLVDFTVADSARATMRWCAEHGVHAVVGTTGLGAGEMDEMRVLFEKSSANCIVAPNFAIGAVLMMRFAELAAGFMDGVEIIELHHDAKRDAPSGTALQTAARIDRGRQASVRAGWPADPTTDTAVEGARGGTAQGIHVHSVRLPGLVAHQEVIFGAQGQSLTLRHDAYDRTSFMPGVLLAVRAVASTPGLTVGLDTLLGF